MSVALTTNVEVVFSGTLFGVPYISPSSVMSNPAGRLPLRMVYVMETAGRTAEADNCIGTINVDDGYVPKLPAGVFQLGCAMLILKQVPSMQYHSDAFCLQDR